MLDCNPSRDCTIRLLIATPNASLKCTCRPEGGWGTCKQQLALKRGSRKPDLRIRTVTKQVAVAAADNHAVETTEEVEHIVAGEQGKIKGRDWLADASWYADPTTRTEVTLPKRATIPAFCFNQVLAAPSPTAAAGDADDAEELVPLSAEAAGQLNAQLATLLAEALWLREFQTAEMEAHAAAKAGAVAALATLAAEAKEGIVSATASVRSSGGGVAAAVATALEWQRRLACAQNALERFPTFPEPVRVHCELLQAAQDRLKHLADALDVDVMCIPFMWNTDHCWIDQSWRTQPTYTTCIMGCGRLVDVMQQTEHTANWTGCTDIGVAPEGTAETGGTSMGGDISITCEITGTLIDAEATCLNDPHNNVAKAACPVRNARYHAVGDANNVNRHVWVHEAVTTLWKHAAGDARDEATLRLLDAHADEYWVQDKQGVYWLLDYVKSVACYGTLRRPLRCAVHATR